MFLHEILHKIHANFEAKKLPIKALTASPVGVGMPNRVEGQGRRRNHRRKFEFLVWIHAFTVSFQCLKEPWDRWDFLPTSTKKCSNKLFLHEIHVNLAVNHTYILYLEYIEYITTKMLRNGQQNISIVEAGSKKHFSLTNHLGSKNSFFKVLCGFFSNMLHFLRESITTSLTSHTLAMDFFGVG